jgi:hypothetical protein
MAIKISGTNVIDDSYAISNVNVAIVASMNVVPTVQSAFLQANTSRDHANASFLQGNSAFTQANSAFAQGNSAFTQANSAFAEANTRTTTGKAIAMAIVFG